MFSMWPESYDGQKAIISSQNFLLNNIPIYISAPQWWDLWRRSIWITTGPKNTYLNEILRWSTLLKNQLQKVCKTAYTCGLILIPCYSKLLIRCYIKLTENLYGIFGMYFS
jgi:hypothetical protein